MAQINFTCPACTKPYSVPSQQAGQKFNCVCGQRVQIPPQVVNKTVLGRMDDPNDWSLRLPAEPEPHPEAIPVLPAIPVARLAPLVPQPFDVSESGFGAAMICCVISAIMGSVGLIFCPIVFSTIGLLVGVVGLMLPKKQAIAAVVLAVGISGVAMSAFGVLVGIANITHAINESNRINRRW